MTSRNISQYYKWGHRAIDVLLPIGTPIIASAAGVVEFSGWNNQGYGNLIIIDHFEIILNFQLKDPCAYLAGGC